MRKIINERQLQKIKSSLKLLKEQPSMDDGVVVLWGPPGEYSGPNTSTEWPYPCQE